MKLRSLVLLAPLLLTSPPTATAAPPARLPHLNSFLADAPTWQRELALEMESLLRLEAFVTITPSATVVIDHLAARAAGFSPDELRLAEELAAHQNQTLAAILAGEATLLGDSRVDWAGRDALRTFLARATLVAGLRADPDQEVPLAQGPLRHPCGDFAAPQPRFRPSWTLLGRFESEAEAWAALDRLGYRPVPEGVGLPGFLRTSSYHPEGCSALAFAGRATLRTLEGSARVQERRGECNPDVFSYPWPSWFWPAYCQWWHSLA